MGQYNFASDLQTAQSTEMEISGLLSSHYGIKTEKIMKTFAFDLLAVGKFGNTRKIEVKEDFMCGVSGNMVIEFECRERPSGISVTQADVYIHKFHEVKCITFWSTPVDVIKQLIYDNKYVRIVSGGDAGSHSKNYLFRLDVFKENSKQLFLV